MNDQEEPGGFRGYEAYTPSVAGDAVSTFCLEKNAICLPLLCTPHALPHQQSSTRRAAFIRADGIRTADGKIGHRCWVLASIARGPWWGVRAPRPRALARPRPDTMRSRRARAEGRAPPIAGSSLRAAGIQHLRALSCTSLTLLYAGSNNQGTLCPPPAARIIVLSERSGCCSLRTRAARAAAAAITCTARVARCA